MMETLDTAVTLPIAGDSTGRGTDASFSSDKWVHGTIEDGELLPKSEIREPARDES